MEILNRSQRYNQFFIESLRFAGIFLICLSTIRYIYFFLSIPHFELIENSVIVQSFLVGLRFDLLVLGFIWLPLVLLAPPFFLLGFQPSSIARVAKVYLSLSWMLVIFSAMVSLPHFLTFGRHFRWRGDGSMFMWPPLDQTSVVLLILIFLMMLLAVPKALAREIFYKIEGRLFRSFPINRVMETLLRILLPLLLVILAARGSIAAHHLEKSDAEISAWEIVNELALNSVWTWDK